MSTITIIDNPHVKLFYHQDTKIVHHIYGPTIGGDFLQEELNAGVDLLKKYGAIKWLSDNRELEEHTREDTDWINNDWLPRAIATGWKYWALVVPNSFMARVNMIEFTESF
ncbi:MAG TPA: hypothetical protein PLZ51_04870, partial [Aggregatilineales bacterium]|nr:hypothetical protein [Aggregatilineales bacterium]